MPPQQSSPSSVRGGRRFGCLFAVLLSGAMGFVIFVGSVMGDCSPGPGCHDDDGAVIGGGLLQAVPIILAFGAAAWLILSVAHALLQERLSPTALNILLTLVTLALVWISFDPAFELYFWWMMA